MLPGPERGKGRLQVVVDVGDDRDQVDLRIGQERTVIGVRLRDAVLPGHLLEPLGPARADRRQLGLRELLEGVDVVFAEPAEADHATTDSVHRNRPLGA